MADAKESKEPARDEHDHLIAESVSAYQKYLRRSDFENALYFALLVFRRAPSYIWRRTLICAAEDIGLADVEAVMRVGQLYAMWKGASEGSWSTSPHHLTLAVWILAKARKDTTIEDAQTEMLESIKAGEVRSVPPFALDAHTRSGRAAGSSWAAWYRDRIEAGIPPNEYTERIWQRRPEWRPIELRDDLLPHEPGERPS